MQTNLREIYKIPLFWAISITAGIVLVFVILLIADPVRTTHPEPEPATTQATLPPTAATEATLPPPAENPYSLFDFAPEGDFVTCTAGPSTLGIDVSEWQETVDWQLVKDAGVEFVMIRVGWRGSEQGILTADTRAQEHYAGAKAAGLKIGAYFFSQAISVEEAEEEAAFALQLIEDWELDMPLVYDWEYIDAQSRTAVVDARMLTDCTKVFCDKVAQAGLTPMIYFNENQSYDQLFLAELTDYAFWLAQYRNALYYPYRVDMWQYTCTGTVPGIAGDVDLNLYFTYD